MTINKTKCLSCNDIPNTKCYSRMRSHINGLRCGKCHYVKSPECFYNNASRPDGKSPHCKQCANSYPARKRPKRQREDGYLLCTRCKEYKLPTSFYVNTRNKVGRDSWCTACHSAYSANRPSTATKSTKYRNKDNKQFSGDRAFLRRFYNYPNQCKRRKKEITFDLTLEQFAEITSSGCYYCGQKSRNKDYVGIDRINSDKGYTIDNCVPCCDVCNKMKSDYDVDFFLTHILKIAAIQNRQ